MIKSAYYAIFIPNDNKYSVIFPDVPGCLPWGDSFEEAFSDAIEALAFHLEGLSDDNDPIPTPSSREQAWSLFIAECKKSNRQVPTETAIQLIPAPDVTQKAKRINISLRPYKIELIDRKAEQLGLNRSEFLALAATSYQIGAQG